MKKAILLSAIVAMSVSAATAQAIYGSSVSVESGTYTALSNATVIYDASTNTTVESTDFDCIFFSPDGDVTEEKEVNGYSIGFTYPFVGQNVTKFVVSGAGFVAFGNDKISVDPTSSQSYLFQTGIYAGAYSHRGCGSVEGTKISYQTITDGDVSTLVVQFENYGVCPTFNSDPVAINMQLHFLSSGDFKVVYSGLSALTSKAYFHCGMRLNDDYMCVTGDSEEYEVSAQSAGYFYAMPTDADGTTVVISAPEKCKAPSAQPTNLNMTVYSTEVSGSFTAAEGADNYLVVYSTETASEWLPVDGTYYSTGKTVEDVTIAYYGTKTKFTNEELAGGTKMFYRVFAVNAYGTDGPCYNTVSPLSAEIATLPAAPTAVVSATTLNSITLDVTANAKGDKVIVLMNTYCERDAYGDHGLFNCASGDVKVGDVLAVSDDFSAVSGFDDPENAGVVVYVGDAKEGITFSNLDSSTQYYYAVFSCNADNVLSSDAAYIDAFTVLEAPYDGNSANYARYRVPGNWLTSEDVTNSKDFRGEYVTTGGTQKLQLRAQITKAKADGINGVDAWVQPQAIAVSEDSEVVVKFDYCMTTQASRLATSLSAYNSWLEDDYLELSVSSDNGETWKTLTKYDWDNNAQQDDTYSYVSIEGSLSEYKGKTVLVRLWWHTTSTAAFGTNMYIDRFYLNLNEDEEGEVVEVVSTYPAEGSTAVYTHRPPIRIEFSEILDWSDDYADYVTVVDKDITYYKGTLTHEVVSNASVLHYYFDEDLPLDKCFIVNVKGGIPSTEGNYTEEYEFRFLSEYRNTTEANVLFALEGDDNFKAPGYSGSTAGLASTGNSLSTSTVTPDNDKNSASYKLTYAFDSSASVWRIREYTLTQSGVNADKTDCNYILSFWVYGDGSNNKISPMLRVNNSPLIYTDPMTTIDFRGWQLVTCDLANDAFKNFTGSTTSFTSWRLDSFYLVHENTDDNAEGPYQAWSGEILLNSLEYNKWDNSEQTAQISDIDFSITGIEDVNIEESAPVEYYNLQGIKVNNPSKGIYIRVQGQKASKVVL